WVTRGQAHGLDKHHDKALADYTQAVAVNPTNAVAHNHRGGALMQLHRVDEALAEFEQAVHLRSDWSPPYFSVRNVLEALRSRGQLEPVVAKYQERVRLHPTDAIVHALLGIAWIVSGQLEKGIVEYREADRLQSGNRAIRDLLHSALMSA